MIECKDLRLAIRGNEILRSISVTVEDGEIAGLLGAAGCGKTMLARAMAGAIPLQGGEMRYDGIPVEEYLGELRHERLSYFKTSVPENTDDTLVNFLFLARMPYKRVFKRYSDYDLQVVERYLDLFGLAPLRDHPLRTLSDSVLQRAVIAHSLITEAKTLIMDDPTSYLDIESVSRLGRALQKYVLSGERTVVLAGNDLNFILQTADRVLLFEPADGSITRCRPEEITADTVRRIYGTEVLLSRNIYNGRPEVHLYIE
ncbi:MAG: ABC transporter ATP-binding protein [Spirochaetes bacterium]|nr:ABC transporter ATP-binding protein [Spirochaetota bacterium]